MLLLPKMTYLSFVAHKLGKMHRNGPFLSLQSLRIRSFKKWFTKHVRFRIMLFILEKHTDRNRKKDRKNVNSLFIKLRV